MNEPTRIFVVSKGDYSDNRNIGVFSTREAADKAGGDYIEEWLLDNLQEAPGHYASFEVVMHRDGTSRRTRQVNYYGQDHSTPHFYLKEHCVAYLGDVSDCGQFQVWAKDATHAIKIVNEKRVQLIAEGKWNQTVS